MEDEKAEKTLIKKGTNGDIDVGKLADLNPGFQARMKEIGISAEDLEAILDESNLDEDRKKKKSELDKLLKDFQEGKIIDPNYYPRDRGRFTAINPWTWRKGMQGPNPLGRPRPRIGLWPRLCQIMEMTEEELAELVGQKITLADKAAIALAQKVISKTGWWQQLEIINREEGKVQDKLLVDTPPQPIRFIATPGREPPEEILPDDDEPPIELIEMKPQDSTDAATPDKEVAPKEEATPSSLSDQEAAEDDSLWTGK